MIIIVEGIDRVGKTTLVNKLKENMDVMVFKDDLLDELKGKLGPTESSLCAASSMSSVLNMCELLDTIIVFDRFHITEHVYGVVDRRVPVSCSVKMFEAINEKLVSSSHDVIIVHVNPTNVKMSSKKHGSNLECHLELFEKRIEELEEEKELCVINTNFDKLDETVTEIMYMFYVKPFSQTKLASKNAEEISEAFRKVGMQDEKSRV